MAGRGPTAPIPRRSATGLDVNSAVIVTRSAVIYIAPSLLMSWFKVTTTSGASIYLNADNCMRVRDNTGDEHGSQAKSIIISSAVCRWR
jgi:hypothetical protein